MKSSVAWWVEVEQTSYGAVKKHSNMLHLQTLPMLQKDCSIQVIEEYLMMSNRPKQYSPVPWTSDLSTLKF